MPAVLRRLLRCWSAGWSSLRYRQRIPGYGAEHWTSRIVINHHAALLALATPAFWHGVAVAAIITLAVQILAWQCDLRGAARDLPFLLPAVLLAPRMALGRRRLVLRVLHGRRRAAG